MSRQEAIEFEHYRMNIANLLAARQLGLLHGPGEGPARSDARGEGSPETGSDLEQFIPSPALARAPEGNHD